MIFSCAVQRRPQAGSQKSGGIPPRLLVFCTYNICTSGNDLVIAERLNLCLETWSNIGNDDDHKQASGNKKASQRNLEICCKRCCSGVAPGSCAASCMKSATEIMDTAKVLEKEICCMYLRQ
ncbi:unnamed protein product [Calypogeia fissa]